MKRREINLLRYIWESHRFFLRESYPYSGVAFVRHPFQWLRAYLRFMRYSVQDAIREKEEA